MKTVQEKDKKLDFEAIQDEDGDWLTHILEPYDELYDEIILLNITKEDLLNKNDSNINQVGYKAPYGDNDEIEGLVYYYFKKCVEWYGNERDPGGLSLEASAKKEALLIIEDEKKYPEHTFLVLLYCEGTYLYSLGG